MEKRLKTIHFHIVKTDFTYDENATKILGKFPKMFLKVKVRLILGVYHAMMHKKEDDGSIVFLRRG